MIPFVHQQGLHVSLYRRRRLLGAPKPPKIKFRMLYHPSRCQPHVWARTCAVFGQKCAYQLFCTLIIYTQNNRSFRVVKDGSPTQSTYLGSSTHGLPRCLNPFRLYPWNGRNLLIRTLYELHNLPKRPQQKFLYPDGPLHRLRQCFGGQNRLAKLSS